MTLSLDSNNNLSVNVPWTDTTYSSQAEAQGGTAVSLCTTGEKYTWNHKADTSDLDSFIATGNVVNGVITFSGIDDTINSGNCGYEVFIEITSSSTNKSPYAKLNTISGEGTSSMTLTYDTDADNGTGTVRLRRIR